MPRSRRAPALRIASHTVESGLGRLAHPVVDLRERVGNGERLGGVVGACPCAGGHDQLFELTSQIVVPSDRLVGRVDGRLRQPRAGRTVRFVTTTGFVELAQDHGLTVEAVPFSVQAALAERSAQRAVEGGGHGASFAAFARIARTAATALAGTALAAAERSDVLVGGLSAVAVGTAATERVGIPLLSALNVPVDATSAWPGALFPNLRVGPRPWSNRTSHRLTRLALWLTVRAGADGWRPDPDLKAFLAAGPPPVYIGFGSMGTDDPAATARLVLDATVAAGVRAIVRRGWARLLAADPPASVHFVESVPHAWLLPHVAAAVHHGGAGTTAASLRAGVPTVIVPFHGDQFFWARRVQELGAGPAPITRRRLTVERLAAALVAATSDPALRGRAAALGERIRAEDGIGDAMRWIEHTVTGG